MPRQAGLRAAFLSPVLAGLVGCAGTTPRPHPITIAREALGGAALFRGYLAVEKGCIVAVGARTSSTVLFDPDVRLLADGTGVLDPATGQAIRFGEPLTGDAAFLRERGRGWSVSDIEQFFGVSLPRGCPRKDVQRLHHLNRARGRNA